jgi:hypothetical protein
MLKLIAQRINSGVRELESVLHKLIAYCQIMEVEVTHELLENIIKEACSQLDYDQEKWEENDENKLELTGGQPKEFMKNENVQGAVKDEKEFQHAKKGTRKDWGVKGRTRRSGSKNAKNSDIIQNSSWKEGKGNFSVDKKQELADKFENKIRPVRGGRPKISGEIVDPVVIQRVISRIAEWCGTSCEQIEGRGRGRNLSVARRLFAIFAKSFLQLSLKEIGMWLGRRNHSTIVYILQINIKNDAEMCQFLGGRLANKFDKKSLVNGIKQIELQDILNLLKIEVQ